MGEWTEWSNQEAQFLKDSYANMTAKELAENLGRPIKSVEGKIWKLGLKKPVQFREFDWNPAPEETGYIAGCLDCDGTIGINVKTREGRRCLDPRIVFYNNHKGLLERMRKLNRRWTING